MIHFQVEQLTIRGTVQRHINLDSVIDCHGTARYIQAIFHRINDR